MYDQSLPESTSWSRTWTEAVVRFVGLVDILEFEGLRRMSFGSFRVSVGDRAGLGDERSNAVDGHASGGGGDENAKGDEGSLR